jgi:putative transposase
MARWARVAAAGIPMHITQRGNDRMRTFQCAEDYAFYQLCLRDASHASGCVIHAYALMTNHIHLLLTPESRYSASELMRRVGCRYVRYFNCRARRTGTLWEGRFRSALVQTQSYFLACSRYIDLNPVRAGIVADAKDYEWSSFRHLAHGAPDSLVRPHGEYLNLAASDAERRETYRRFCEVTGGRFTRDAIHRATQSNTFVGDETFGEQLEAALRRPVSRRWVGGSVRRQSPDRIPSTADRGR